MAESLSKSRWRFDPRSIPRCLSWIDATDASTLTTSGNNVTAIRDKAVYVNYNVTGTVTTGLSNLNGNNLLVFNNDCSAVFAANGTYSNAYRTLIFVAQIDNSSIPGVTPRTYQFYTGPTSGASVSLGYWHATASIQGGRSGLNAVDVVASNIPSGFFNSSFLFSFANNPNNIRLNGTALTLTTNTAFTFTTGALSQNINGSAGNRQGWRLGELLLYDDQLTSNRLQVIEGYLAWKWGLTANLPVGHPYKTTQIFGKVFNPIVDLSGCILWLDAADATSITISSGSNVSQWSDKSGSNNHAAQATASNQPVVVSNARNGLSVIRFSGLGGVNRTDTRFLDNSAMSFPNAPYTIFAVAQAVANASSSAYGYNYIFKPSRSTDWYYMMGSLSNAFTTFAGSATAWNDTTALAGGTQPTSNWTVFTVANTGTANGLLSYISGNARTAKNGTTAGPATGYTLGDAGVGFRGQNWNGDIAEIMVFNRDMSYTDRYIIEGYLAWKWGITADLPAAHSYKDTRLNPQGI